MTYSDEDDREFPQANIWYTLRGQRMHLLEIAKITFYIWNSVCYNCDKQCEKSLLSMSDLQHKRYLMKTINDELINVGQIGYSRDCSIGSFMTNLIASIITYHFIPKESFLKYETVKKTTFGVVLLIELKYIEFHKANPRIILSDSSRSLW